MNVDCWDADWRENQQKVMVGFAPGFQQDVFRIPQTVPRLRQDAWEREFALERVALMDRIVQTQLLQKRKGGRRISL